MYSQHPALLTPPDDTTLWRYMSFTKFASILAKDALFFVRADHLGDPYEGTLGLLNFIEGSSGHSAHENPDTWRMKRDNFEAMKKLHLVNCWHENEYESEAMWSRYSNFEDGIAIKTSFRSLADSLTCESTVEISRVLYLDYERDKIPEGFMFAPLLCKRKHFEHEKEVRAFIFDFPDTGSDGYAVFKQTPGDYYGVDVSVLVEEVVLAPSAAPWLEEVVQTIANKFGLNVPIWKSSLGEKPFGV